MYLFCRIGSDEDDESADDESQSNEDDPSETAVSINARRITDIVSLDDNEDSHPRQEGLSEVEATSRSKQALGQPSQCDQDQGDADQGASNGKTDIPQMEYVNGDVRKYIENIE